MNPYEVLGVAPTATMAEIEAAYRLQLRSHHPDLHHGGSAEELTRAEAMTRNLNEAMALVRGGWRPLPGSSAGFHYDDRGWGTAPRGGPGGRAAPPEGERWDEPFTAEPGTDWFGNPIGRKGAEAVDCPICGRIFNDPLVYRSHLDHDHRLATTPPPAGPVDRDRWHWLTFVPAPTFWLCFVLVVYWAVVATFVPWPYSIPCIWVGVGAFGFLLNRALRDRHTW